MKYIGWPVYSTFNRLYFAIIYIYISYVVVLFVVLYRLLLPNEPWANFTRLSLCNTGSQESLYGWSPRTLSPAVLPGPEPQTADDDLDDLIGEW